MRQHIIVYLRKDTFNRMRSRDRLRKRKGLPPGTQKDLLHFANEVEMEVLEFESEMRAVRITLVCVPN